MEFVPRIIVPHPPPQTHTHILTHTHTHAHTENCSLDDWNRMGAPQVIVPQTIAPKTIPVWQFPHGQKNKKRSFGCFVLFIIVPRTIAAEQNSCFFFFFFFLGCKLVPNYDFCIRKQFINTAWLKLLRNKEQVKDKMSVEQWNKFPHSLPTDRDWEGLPSKTS